MASLTERLQRQLPARTDRSVMGLLPEHLQLQLSGKIDRSEAVRRPGPLLLKLSQEEHLQFLEMVQLMAHQLLLEQGSGSNLATDLLPELVLDKP